MSADRRGLFRGLAGFGAGVTLPAQDARAQAPQGLAPTPAPVRPPPGTVAAWRAGVRDVPAAPPYRFLNPAEAAFVQSAVDRLIPADDEWPGALWAGVATYIDGQLGGAYGQGGRFYAQGPWAQGTPSQGYQLPLNPSQLYRTALERILPALPGFASAAPEARDEALRRVERGEVDCGAFRSDMFFETLLANTIEGWFADPAYGGNRDMVSWRMIGFPGAHAAWRTTYIRHGMKLDAEPMPMGAVGAAQHEERDRHDHGPQGGGHRHG